MTVRRRLLLVLTALSLAAAAVVALASALVMRRAIRERFVERVRAETALVAQFVERGHAAVPQPFAIDTAQRLGLRVTLIAEDGTVVGDSALDAGPLATLENHAGRPEIRAAALGGSGESFRRSATTDVEYYYSARRVAGEGPIRYVRLALPSSEIHAAQSRDVLLVVLFVPVALLLVSVVSYGAVRRLSHPVEHIASAVERAARGNEPIELPDDGGEELVRLGQAVHTMQARLVEQLDELGAERALHSSVVEGMQEGLLLVGADRHVRLANRSLRRTLELGFDAVGHPLAEVVRHPAALAEIESALERGEGVRESILRLPSGRAFQLRATPLRRGAAAPVDAVIVLLFDITRLEKLEGVRRDFVANVSHELRTPLTSIKAFVETLLDGGLADSANAERFLGIIRKHADRMGALIEDLTDLSLIETGAISLQIAPLDAAEVVRGVIDHLQPLAERRAIEVRSEFAEPFPLRADRRRLEQMLTNLVDNALKFSERGDRIFVRGELRSGTVVIRVDDEGLGIPAASLDKIFHRFYQEHRDESREAGGTGLGLSIVKHLMRLHGGVVRVESELGRGSSFLLEFPEA